MKYYDVIIVGGGIAGTGLAYNLNQECPNKSVLVIDNKGTGQNASFVYRNTFKEVIDKYDLPYRHKFDGARIGSHDEYFQLEKNMYFIDYPKVCKYLLKNSNAVFKKEKGINFKKRIIYTNKNKYKFNFLIDCSGSKFFLRKLHNLPLPFKYWVGNVKILKNKNCKLDNYFYFLCSEEGYLEDIYPLKNKIIHGDWQYTNRIDFNLIKISEKNLYNKLVKKAVIIKEEKVVIPSSFVFPLVFGRCAFLGDSFGNATTSSSEGIKPILDSSCILAKAIKHNNLRTYAKNWKKKYFHSYIKKLALKSDNKIKLNMVKVFKKNPNLILRMNETDNPKIPSEIKKIIPLRKKIQLILFYLFLRLNYEISYIKFKIISKYI